MHSVESLLPHHLTHRVVEFAAFGEAATGIAMRTMAKEVARQAQRNAQTGHHEPHGEHIPGTGPGPNTATKKLLNNINYTMPTLGTLGSWKVQVGVGGDAYYAALVEKFGLTNGATYPFLMPAIQQVKERVAPALWASSFAEFKIVTGI